MRELGGILEVMKTTPHSKNAKKRTKFWYIQDCGTYKAEIPVFVGYSESEITAIIKKQKSWKKEAVSAWVEEHTDGKEDTTMIGKLGWCWIHQDGWLVFSLGKFEDTWDDYETILHECFHIVIAILGISKMFINHSRGVIEEEGMAYLQEYLFRGIRKKLQSAFKIKH